MKRFAKTLISILIMIFLCQNVVCCFSENNSALRPPLIFSDENKEVLNEILKLKKDFDELANIVIAGIISFGHVCAFNNNDVKRIIEDILGSNLKGGSLPKELLKSDKEVIDLFLMAAVLYSTRTLQINGKIPVAAIAFNSKSGETIVGQRPTYVFKEKEIWPAEFAEIPERNNVWPEGFARLDTDEHAEMNALRKATEKEWKMEDTQVFISLESCENCAMGIANIFRPRRVVAATVDPFPGIQGKGNQITKGAEIPIELIWYDSLREKGEQYISEDHDASPRVANLQINPNAKEEDKKFGSPDFDDRDFKSDADSKLIDLWKKINDDVRIKQFIAEKATIGNLNNLLAEVNLFDPKRIPLNVDMDFTLLQLIRMTGKIVEKSVAGTVLTVKEELMIKKRNRRLLEYLYPGVTPKRKYDFSEEEWNYSDNEANLNILKRLVFKEPETLITFQREIRTRAYFLVKNIIKGSVESLDVNYPAIMPIDANKTNASGSRGDRHRYDSFIDELIRERLKHRRMGNMFKVIFIGTKENIRARYEELKKSKLLGDDLTGKVKVMILGEKPEDVRLVDYSYWDTAERLAEIKIGITEILKKDSIESTDKQRFLKLWRDFSELKDEDMDAAEKEALKQELKNKKELQEIKSQFKENSLNADETIDNVIEIIADNLSISHLSNYIKDAGHGFDHSIRLCNTLIELLRKNNGNDLIKINIDNFVTALFMHDLGHFIQGYKHNISSRYMAESLLEKKKMKRENIAWIGTVIEAHNHRDLRDKRAYEIYEAKLIKDLDAFDSTNNLDIAADIGLKFKQDLFIGKWSLEERLKVLIFDNDSWNRNNPQLIADGKTFNYDILTHRLFAVVIERLPAFYKTKEMQNMVAEKYKYNDFRNFKEAAKRSLNEVVNYAIEQETNSGIRKEAKLKDEEENGIDMAFNSLADFVLWCRRDKNFNESFLCGVRDDNSEEQKRIKYMTERIATFLNELVYIVKEIGGRLVIISEMPRYLAEEKGLDFTEEKGMSRYADEADSSLEFIDIIGIDTAGNEKVIGKTLRKKGISDLVHEKGLLHRTANAFVVTPRGEIVIDRRAHNKAQPLRLSILGGHVLSGRQYRETIRKELPEELGFPEGWVLQGKFVTIGKEGGFTYNDGKNNERRSLEVYVLSKEEYQMVMQGKQQMDDEKATKTEAGYKTALEEKQMSGKGGGEVWGRYIFDINKILNSARDSEGPYIELSDAFKDSEKRDKVRFTADLLQPLLEDKQVMMEITRIVQKIQIQSQDLLKTRDLLDRSI